MHQKEKSEINILNGYGYKDELTSITDKWMYFFKGCKETSPRDLNKIVGSDFILERAYHELDRHYWTEEELLTYEQSKKYLGTYNASMRQKYDEGMEKGRAEGREEGIAQGIAIAERKAKLEAAEVLKKMGIPLSEISKTMGLSIEDLKN